VKNWKKRHFIIYNEADNFKIEYYDKKNGSLKGTIEPAGYMIQDFDQDDNAQHGGIGLKLVPHQKLRRTWYVRFENEEEKNEWKPVFARACYKVIQYVLQFIVNNSTKSSGSST
jgi:hypothetical protein